MFLIGKNYPKVYWNGYKEISGHDPMICRHCGHEMELWKIWHPDYGVIYDECENLKARKYDPVPEQEEEGRYSVWPPAGGIQLSLFPIPA